MQAWRGEGRECRRNQGVGQGMKRDIWQDRRVVYQHSQLSWAWRVAVLLAALCLGLLTLLLPAVELVKAPTPKPIVYRGVNTVGWTAPELPRQPEPLPPEPAAPVEQEAVPELPAPAMPRSEPSAPAPLRLPLAYDFQASASSPDVALHFVVDRGVREIAAEGGALAAAPGQPAAAAAAGDGPATYASDQVEQLPEIREQVRPLYPYRARVRGVEGHVDLRFVVDETGRVCEEHVMADSPPDVFAEAALRALRRWQFRPGRHGGQSVRTLMQVRICFELED